MQEKDFYCAIIADIKDSTKIDDENRIKIQNDLRQIIIKYNQEYKDKLVVNLTFSAGDRIQGLFKDCHEAYLFACKFRESLLPVCFRIGLGYGDWFGKFDASSNEQLGRSYYRAGEAYEKAHKEDKGIVFNSEQKVDAVINLLIDAEDKIFSNQTIKQKNLSNEYFRLNPLEPIDVDKDSFPIYIIKYNKGSQKYILDEAKVKTTKQNISQQIKRAQIDSQRELRAAVVILLKNCSKDNKNYLIGDLEIK